MILRPASALFALAALAGCAVGPDYQGPELDIDPAFSEAASENDALIAIGPDIDKRWWESFEDETLTMLIEEARAHNLDLVIAASRIEEARALRGATIAAGLPQINVENAGGRSRQSENAGGIGAAAAEIPGIPLEQDLFEATFNASWEIDLFGRIRRRVNAADARLDAAVEDRRDLMVIVFAEVARNYVELRSLQNQLAVAKRNEAIARQSLELTELLETRGLGSEFDRVRARADLQETIAIQADLEAAQRSSAAALAVLVGKQPADLMTTLLAPAPTPTHAKVIPVGLPSDLIRRRPDVRAAERRLAAATEDVGGEIADLFPSFVLTGAFGGASTSVDQLFSSGSEAWNYAGIVRWPIFTGGLERAEIRAARAGLEGARASYELAVLNALNDVESALAVYVFAVKERDTLLTARTDRQRGLELAEMRYRNGLDDLFQLLDAQRRLINLESEIAAADAALLSSAVSVYKVLGGGWEHSR